jgi:lipopolysaccharide O-acetyltransferase
MKKLISKLFFQNKYALGIKHIGKNSKVGLLHNFLNGQYISIGDHTSIGRYARLHCYDHYNGVNLKPRIDIGSECIFGPNLTILCADSVVIEDHVAFAGYITIVNENHGTDVENELPFYRQTLTTAPVRVKEGAWIGERCCILPGVTIGKKCIIGSGSVVTKTIPDYSIAVGNPAKVVKTWNFETHTWEKVQES